MAELRAPNYLRLSVTDRCNLRCFYCMPPKGLPLASREEVLSFEELERLARVFVSLGVEHIRLTGGEPLMRRGSMELVGRLSGLASDLSLTTNGLLLAQLARALKEAGLGRVNVSVDTLRREKFKSITRVDALHRVLEGIEAAKGAGLEPVKLNMVVMRGVNDDEVFDFVEFAAERRLVLRFIEFMSSTPFWREELFVPIEEVISALRERFEMQELSRIGPGPARYFKLDGEVLVGFIGRSEEVCGECGRLRLSSIGELRVCLFEPRGLDLKRILRSGATDEELALAIRERFKAKARGDFRRVRGAMPMCKIGG